MNHKLQVLADDEKLTQYRLNVAEHMPDGDYKRTVIKGIEVRVAALDREQKAA